MMPTVSLHLVESHFLNFRPLTILKQEGGKEKNGRRKRNLQNIQFAVYPPRLLMWSTATLGSVFTVLEIVNDCPLLLLVHLEKFPRISILQRVLYTIKPEPYSTHLLLRQFRRFTLLYILTKIHRMKKNIFCRGEIIKLWVFSRNHLACRAIKSTGGPYNYFALLFFFRL